MNNLGIKIRVPYALSFYDEDEIQAVTNVLKSGNTMAGKNVEELEKSVSKAFGHDHGVMCNSGSSALTLAYSALNLKVGGEVITPALTFSTTIASQIQAGLIPVLIDSHKDTLNVNIDNIKKAISKDTVAIAIPDLMGNFADWDQIKNIASEINVPLIHDSADTIGHKLRGSPVGMRADISTTSFYGAHIINGAGNGGMVTTSSKELANRLKVFRSWGRESSLFGESEKIENRFDCYVDNISYDRKYIFSEIGYNLEGSEIGAAFANVQFKKLDEFKKRRRFVFDMHLEFIKKFPDFFITPSELDEAEVVWYAFPIILKEGIDFSRTDLQIYLEKNDIQTRPVFAGNILRQPGYKNQKMRVVGTLENADYIMKNALVIGCHQGMDDRHINWAHHCINNFLKGSRA